MGDFVRGGFVQGDFVCGDFVLGGFCPGGFVRGDFVLEPRKLPSTICTRFSCCPIYLTCISCFSAKLGFQANCVRSKRETSAL